MPLLASIAASGGKRYRAQRKGEEGFQRRKGGVKDFTYWWRERGFIKCREKEEKCQHSKEITRE